MSIKRKMENFVFLDIVKMAYIFIKLKIIIDDHNDEIEIIDDDEIIDDADEEFTDETPDETEDSDEPEMIQTGGIVIFDDSRLSFDRPESHHKILGQGGTNWQDGPSLTVFGPIGSQFGSMIKLVKVEDKTLLGVIAPKAGKNGTIYFYDPETLAELFAVTVPPSLGMGDNGSFTDFDTFSDKDGKFTLVAGGKYFKDYGRVLCAQITPDNVEELVECLWQPETTTGGFGSSVKNVGKIDGEYRENIVIGMPEYITYYYKLSGHQ